MAVRDQSIVTSSVLAIAGTAVQVFEKVDPALLGLAAAPWLGPLAIAAGAVGGLGINRIASALDRREDARHAARELLANQDITRAQAAAVAARIERVREEIPGGREQRKLRRLAASAPDWWQRIIQAEARRWLGVADETELVETLSAHLAGEDRQAAAPAAWVVVLGRAEREVLGEVLEAETRGRLVDELSRCFVADTFEAIKSDSKAFASVVLRFLAEILADVRASSRVQVSEPKLDEALARIVDAARNLEALSLLPAALADLAGDVRDTRDAARAARDASEATFRLVSDKLASSPVRIPFQLPPAAQRFVGRKAERTRLLELLRDAQPSCFVVGLPGMGKTALAADTVSKIVGERGEKLAESRFPDGVLFVDAYRLRGSADAVFSVLIETLEPSLLSAGGEPHALAERACRARRMLVILEGAEELGDALARVLDVFDSTTKRLVLTRSSGQAVAGRLVDLVDIGEPDALPLSANESETVG